MAPLGPFGPDAAVVAGGLGRRRQPGAGLLAHGWARLGAARLACIVDHGLRPEIARGGRAHRASGWPRAAFRRAIMRLDDLAPGPALAERARPRGYARL